MDRHLFEEEHELFRAAVRTFITREVAPNFEAWERDGIVDRDLFRLAGAAGLLGLGVPCELGGGGADDFRFNVILIEEFAASGFMNAAQGLMLQTNVLLPYFTKHATLAQQERWVPGLCAGETIGGIAMTEPATGSDLGGITTTARLDGDSYVIAGSKLFISNAINGDLFLVVCRTEPGSTGPRGLSLIVVESTASGFQRGRNLAKIGQHSADTGELFFDDVRVPRDNLIGQEGRGFDYLVRGLPQERLTIAWQAATHAWAAFEWTMEYARSRMAFGQPIGTFQHNRFTLATLRTELDIARVFLDQQVLAHNRSDLTAEDAAESKWWCAELNKRVLDTCLQLHGGYGYMDDHPIARAWKDGRAMSIYGGTTEIMKEIIGRRSLGL